MNCPSSQVLLANNLYAFTPQKSIMSVRNGLLLKNDVLVLEGSPAPSFGWPPSNRLSLFPPFPDREFMHLIHTQIYFWPGSVLNH